MDNVWLVADISQQRIRLHTLRVFSTLEEAKTYFSNNLTWSIWEVNSSGAPKNVSEQIRKEMRKGNQ